MWWKTLFDHSYLKIYLNAFTTEQTEKQSRFIIKTIHLRKGAKVLDLACGWGRHTISLAKRGLQMTGIDLSKPFLDLAQKEAKKYGVKVWFSMKDMRHITFVNEFNAVISMGTSFGYFEKESDHLIVLEKIARSLKPRGKFLLDVNNGFKALMDLSRDGTINRKTGLLTGIKRHAVLYGNVVRTQDEFNPANMRWILTRSWKEKGRRYRYRSSVRFFSLPELRSLLSEGGFDIERVWGDFDSSPYSVDSPRMIILACKR